ncbi:MAG: hypothetical protein H6703_09140 [Myxococcales bacterium]|nr:hypothetical protein [Myxococcales bacterium]
MSRGVALLGAVVVAAAVWWGTASRAPQPTTLAGPLPPVPHGAATALLPLADGLAVGGDGGGISIRDAAGAVRHAWTAHAGPVRRLWVDDAGALYSAGADGSVARWTLDGRRLDRWRLADHALNDAARGPDGAIVVGGDRGVVARIDAAGWIARGSHGRATFAVALSPDGAEALTGGADGRIVRWAVADGAPLAAAAVTTGWVTAVHWDARWRLVGASDGRLSVWQGPGEAPARVVAVEGGAIVALAVEGDRAVVGSEDGRARVVALATGVIGPTLDPAEAPVGPTTAVALAGERAWTGGRDDRIRAWRVTDGERLATLPAVIADPSPREF